jgi:hypothetical protein
MIGVLVNQQPPSPKRRKKGVTNNQFSINVGSTSNREKLRAKKILIGQLG